MKNSFTSTSASTSPSASTRGVTAPATATVASIPTSRDNEALGATSVPAASAAAPAVLPAAIATPTPPSSASSVASGVVLDTHPAIARSGVLGLWRPMLSLKRATIEDDWGEILEGCAGEGEGVLQNVETNLRAAEPPGVEWERTSVAPSWAKGVLGKRRDFLYVRSERFPRHTLAVNARDFGRNLDVSWYLVLQPVIPTIVLAALVIGVSLFALTVSPTAALVAFLFGIGGIGYLRLRRDRRLDLFDQQDLRAYKTVAHHAVLEATKRIMTAHDLDASRLRRESRGRFSVAG